MYLYLRCGGHATTAAMPSRLPAHLETRAQPRRAVLATITATALAASGVHGFAIPSAAQLRWQGYEVGAMVTFGMQTMMSPAQRHCGAPLPSADKFNPTALDTDQWVASAVAFGAQVSKLQRPELDTPCDPCAHAQRIGHASQRKGP